MEVNKPRGLILPASPKPEPPSMPHNLFYFKKTGIGTMSQTFHPISHILLPLVSLDSEVVESKRNWRGHFKTSLLKRNIKGNRFSASTSSPLSLVCSVGTLNGIRLGSFQTIDSTSPFCTFHHEKILSGRAREVWEILQHKM